MIVRKLRLQRGWSQDQLAEFTGLNVRTIQRLERGQNPSLESSKALASVFEVDLSTFTIEDTEMNEKVELADDEQEAIAYVKGVKDFYSGLFVYLILGIVFFSVFGFYNPIVYIVFAISGFGVIFQGLISFEIIRPATHNWEKRLIEKRLGRKL